MIRIRFVEPLEDYWVRLKFSDGSEKVVDLSTYLHGPVFEQIRLDRQLFRAVSVDPELGTICWPNGADVDPDVLYGDLAPAWLETERTSDRKAS